MQCNTKEFHKREKLLEVANDLMELWIEDTRDAESRVLVITNDIQDVKKLENWINNEFDFAPTFGTKTRMMTGCGSVGSKPVTCPSRGRCWLENHTKAPTSGSDRSWVASSIGW